MPSDISKALKGITQQYKVVLDISRAATASMSKVHSKADIPRWLQDSAKSIGKEQPWIRAIRPLLLVVLSVNKDTELSEERRKKVTEDLRSLMVAAAELVDDRRDNEGQSHWTNMMCVIDQV